MPVLLPPAAAAAVFFVAIGLLLPDAGRRKPGRVLVDEGHGEWEWTTESFGTDWYGGASTYNYWSIFDYVSAHLAVSRNHRHITADVLRDADVLVVKTPNRQYQPDEIDVIETWVRNGGGLYLIGDHTNVFGMTTCLNPVAERFGMHFQYDSTHELEEGGLQRADVPEMLRHPALADAPNRLLWGTSCSLTADWNVDPVFIGPRMRTRYLDYGRRGFFATSYLMPTERYGLLLQCASATIGRGRVLAWTDSTIFSNFWAFFPGKSEIFLGSIWWLNHENTGRIAGWMSVVAGVSLASLVVLALRRRKGSPMPAAGLWLIAVALGLPAGIAARDAAVHRWYVLPTPRVPVNKLIFERQYSQIGVPDFDMQGEQASSYQTFYTWVQRVGVIPRCHYTWSDALTQGDRVVSILPGRAVTDDDVHRLDEFLARGGRLLVIDSQRNLRSQGNLLLEHFGMSINYRPQDGGEVVVAPGTGTAPAGTITSPCTVRGGNALATAGNATVVARTRVGLGEIWVASIGDLWSDETLGTGNTRLQPHQQFASELEYWLLQAFCAHDTDAPVTLAAK